MDIKAGGHWGGGGLQQITEIASDSKGRGEQMKSLAART